MGMGLPNATLPPDAPVTEAVDQTPTPEQPASTQPVASAPPAADPSVSLQAAFTQTSQTLSAVRSALGLGKHSTSAEILAAIATAKEAARLAAQPAHSEYSDPKLAQQAAELEERGWRVATAQYGPTADLAKGVLDALRGQRDPLVIAEIFNEAVQTAALSAAAPRPVPTPQGAPAPATGTQAPAQAPERDLMADMPRGSDGMRTLDPRVDAKQYQGRTGDFFRDMLPGIFGPRS